MADRLQLLLAAAERLTVDLIAQDPVVIRPATDTPAYARHIADSEHFDVLPVKDGDRIVRYVRRPALDRADDWNEVPFDDIRPDDIVSASSPLLELLDRFSHERPRLFVLGRRYIDRIATVYDLNQPAAHQFGFALSLVVETEVGHAIEQAARARPNELEINVDERIRSHIDELPEDGYGGAKNRARKWTKKVQRGEQVRLTRELVFHDKLGLIELMGLAPALASRCRPPYGDSGDALLRYLRKHVKALRNAVAHDRDDLADEWSMWEWMRTTLHVAEDLAQRG